jgi:ribosomal protein S18 acetylase RimI-like enzyme
MLCVILYQVYNASLGNVKEVVIRMADMKIRRFRESDREAIKRITAESFEGVSQDDNLEKMFGLLGGTDWQQRKTGGVAAELDSYTDHVFVCEIDGTVAGYVTTNIDTTTKVGHIRNLAVDRSLQKQGMGRALIHGALQYFREEGMEVAKIETLEQNAICRKFYPSFGFKEYARQIHYAMRL